MLKRFIKKLFCLLPIPAVLIGFNIFVDPLHFIDSDKYVSGLASLILEGKNVTNIADPDWADCLRIIIQGFSIKKDVLIFGSSRSQAIHSSSFPGKSFFNNSIPGAGIVDYMALYAMYKEKNLIPSIAVLELSPWIVYHDYRSIWKSFNDQKQNLTESLSNSPNGAQRTIEPDPFIPDKYKELTSLGYFQTSFFSFIRDLIIGQKAKSSYYVFKLGDIPNGSTMLADGSFIVPDRIQDRDDLVKNRALAISYGEKPVGIPMQIDFESIRLLEGFTQQLKRDGVKTVLFIPPYHPQSYKMLIRSDRFKIIKTIQEYFEKFARTNDMTIIGSYDPSDLGLDETYFFDGSHSTDEAIKNIFDGKVPGLAMAENQHYDAVSSISLLGVRNPNGIEIVNNKSFFWMGGGTTCLRISTSEVGDAVLTFQGVPGSSLPIERKCKLKIDVGHYSRIVTVDDYPQMCLSFPVVKGVNELCVTPIDKPIERTLPNGDSRELMLGVSNLTLKLFPKSLEGMDECFVIRYAGWYPVERDDYDWWRWTSQPSQIIFFSRPKSKLNLNFEMCSAIIPNTVNITLNGRNIQTITLNQASYSHFSLILDNVIAGENVVEFISRNPGIKIPNDDRLLSIAIKNVALSNASPGSPVP